MPENNAEFGEQDELRPEYDEALLTELSKKWGSREICRGFSSRHELGETGS